VNLGSDSLGNSNDLGVSSVSRIHFGFGFIVNPDPDPITEYALTHNAHGVQKVSSPKARRQSLGEQIDGLRQ